MYIVRTPARAQCFATRSLPSKRLAPAAQRYRVRFAGTLKFLPERHGFAPDTLHVCYHLCVVTTLLLLSHA